ncbi:hypothetical protein RHMOL_Rhmol01G0039500 [Rhododendron molle]|uniref:Uncharacterized protein n=1 Tax=Rhododendron molle TaxID=49168 RepID=A0ACC0PZQ3_RHOML|nr:hypothetical protein RHMOL_Rhmol01G0039500 [Rhododendron molle]
MMQCFIPNIFSVINGTNFKNSFRIIKYLLKWLKAKKEIYVNARNGSGWTALDIHSRVAESEDKKSEYHGMGDVLREFGVEKSDKLFFPFDPYWPKKKNGTLLIVSSLIATILFQVGITPPGGVWVDSSPGHEAGKAIIAYTNPKAYSYFMFFNTVGFLLCLTTVLELIVVLPTRKRGSGFIRAGISWSTIMIIVFAYTFSVIVVSPTPTEMYKSVNFFVLATVIVWAVGITFVRVPYQVQLILLGLPIILPVFLGLYFCGIAEELCRTEPIESTVQSTRDTASPKPTAASQNETRVSIPV